MSHGQNIRVTVSIMDSRVLLKIDIGFYIGVILCPH